VGELVVSFLLLVGQGKLPRGSVALLDSLTSLAMLVQTAWMDRFAAKASRLAASLGGNVAVIPAPLVAWAGGHEPS
jgi:hypothetical protein